MRLFFPSLYKHGIYSSIVADNIDCTDSLKSILPVACVRSLTEQLNDLSNVTSQWVGRTEVPTDRVAESKIIQCYCFINEWIFRTTNWYHWKPPPKEKKNHHFREFSFIEIAKVVHQNASEKFYWKQREKVNITLFYPILQCS